MMAMVMVMTMIDHHSLLVASKDFQIVPFLWFISGWWIHGTSYIYSIDFCVSIQKCMRQWQQQQHQHRMNSILPHCNRTLNGANYKYGCDWVQIKRILTTHTHTHSQVYTSIQRVNTLQAMNTSSLNIAGFLGGRELHFQSYGKINWMIWNTMCNTHTHINLCAHMNIFAKVTQSAKIVRMVLQIYDYTYAHKINGNFMSPRHSSRRKTSSTSICT